MVIADIYINGDVWNKLTPNQQKAIEIAADASLIRSLCYWIYENGKAPKDLSENHGVQLHDTPTDYFTEYMTVVGEAPLGGTGRSGLVRGASRA